MYALIPDSPSPGVLCFSIDNGNDNVQNEFQNMLYGCGIGLVSIKKWGDYMNSIDHINQTCH